VGSLGRRSHSDRLLCRGPLFEPLQRRPLAALVSVHVLHLRENRRRDLDEVPKEPFKDIRFVFVENMRQVFREALMDKVMPPVTSGTRLQRLPQAANARPV